MCQIVSTAAVVPVSSCLHIRFITGSQCGRDARAEHSGIGARRAFSLHVTLEKISFPILNPPAICFNLLLLLLLLLPVARLATCKTILQAHQHEILTVDWSMPLSCRYAWKGAHSPRTCWIVERHSAALANTKEQVQ